MIGTGTTHSGLFHGTMGDRAYQEAQQQAMRDDVREPFLSLVSNQCLDRYFDTCKEAITENIHLYDMFQQYYSA